DGVTMQPSWAVMTTFDQPLELPFDGAFVNDAPLSWVARNSSKPGRPGDDSWVLHASPAWSMEHLELCADDAAGRLLEAFFEATGREPVEPLHLRAHRWRYALAEEALDVGCLWDGELRIGACGDWCAGSRVEGAFLSGMAVAGRILG
ncbi:MAG: FAD-dependent oxidoreductase, partial [Acidobacteriota bacterium]